MKLVETHKVDIYIGFREQYTEVRHTYDKLLDICQEFCETGLCVSVVQTDFIYTGGRENGAKITLINYPRFPSTIEKLTLTATELGVILMKEFKQFRVSIVADNKTFMLENKKIDEWEKNTND